MPPSSPSQDTDEFRLVVMNHVQAVSPLQMFYTAVNAPFVPFESSTWYTLVLVVIYVHFTTSS